MFIEADSDIARSVCDELEFQVYMRQPFFCSFDDRGCQDGWRIFLKENFQGSPACPVFGERNQESGQML
ncbi:hypothetical protein ALP29_201127 [Pseudomonas syringae pv. avii]|uniref:Uncharacterized protein n=1 Tax=Pseudomonas syringae pv. avii TaxID=663959 RepID=A0A3M5W175_PSESX|nr:hypothetical protein ALP29_201127 [Pseudomonas syringae pv. avii]